MVGGKRKSRKRARVEEVIETDGHYYHVEVIKEVRMRGGEWEYLVQWAGYPGEDSWEPFACVKMCQRLLTSLWSMVGSDAQPRVGTIKLPQEWIESEIRYFHEKYDNDFERCIPINHDKKKKHCIQRRVSKAANGKH